MKQLFGILILTYFSVQFSFSQKLNVLASSGFYSESSTHSVEWTIGEVVIATGTNGTFDVTQGFHQSNVFVTGVKELEELEISVYPNPTASFINIDTPNVLRLSIFDMGGKLIGRYDLIEPTNQIDVSHLSRGTYNLLFESKDFEKKSSQLIVQ